MGMTYKGGINLPNGIVKIKKTQTSIISARYWRLMPTADTLIDGYPKLSVFWEIQGFETVDNTGDNVLLGSTVTTESTHESFYPSYMVDGMGFETSYWAGNHSTSATEYQWIVFETTEPVTIRSLSLYSGMYGGNNYTYYPHCPSKYNLEYSTNGVDWSVVTSFEPNIHINTGPYWDNITDLQ